MPTCYAKGCRSTTKCKKSKIQLEWEQSHGMKISFHRIPKNPQVRKEWLYIMGLDDNNVPETASFCSLHFKEKDLDRTSLVCTRLRSTAIPFENVSILQGNVGRNENEGPPPKQQKMQEEHSEERKMPVRCAAIGCRNTVDVKRKPIAQIELEKVTKLTFHTFPFNPVRRAEWIRILGLENKNINNRSRLCSLHFKEEYIDRTSEVYVRLRENAIPHIFEDIYDKMDIDEIESALPEDLNIEIKTESNFKEEPAFLLECDGGAKTLLPSLPLETWKSTQDKETRISPERIWNMNFSSMEAIRQANNIEIERLRKKIQTLTRQIWRKDKQIATMKTILHKFKMENLI